jgi:hypothetical protein
MRILLIAGSRVGGTRIGEWIGYETNIEYIHEPISQWRYDAEKYDINKKKLNDKISPLIVKIFPDNREWDIVKDKGWDKIIGIVRNNEIECVQSILMAEETNVWHKDYSITNEWLIENKGRIEDNKSRVREWREWIENSKDIECIVSYEGIFDSGEDRDKIKGYIGITNPKCEGVLSKELRYRKDTLKPKIKTLI